MNSVSAAVPAPQQLECMWREGGGRGKREREGESEGVRREGERVSNCLGHITLRAAH